MNIPFFKLMVIIKSFFFLIPTGTAVITINARDVDTKENNTLFDFKIVSDPPLHDHDLEFYLTQVSETATISFKGCLNHEVRGLVA